MSTCPVFFWGTKTTCPVSFWRIKMTRPVSFWRTKTTCPYPFGVQRQPGLYPFWVRRRPVLYPLGVQRRPVLCPFGVGTKTSCPVFFWSTKTPILYPIGVQRRHLLYPFILKIQTWPPVRVSFLEYKDDLSWDRMPGHKFNKRLESFAPCYSQSLLLANFKENYPLLFSGFQNPYKNTWNNKSWVYFWIAFVEGIPSLQYYTLHNSLRAGEVYVGVRDTNHVCGHARRRQTDQARRQVGALNRLSYNLKGWVTR